jgi:hypothetical protein
LSGRRKGELGGEERWLSRRGKRELGEGGKKTEQKEEKKIFGEEG